MEREIRSPARAQARIIAVAGGGTAGHILAGVAFLEAWRDLYGGDGFFIGCGGMETQLVPERGFRVEQVAAFPFARQNLTGKARAFAGVARGFLQARTLLRRTRTKLVIGTGGYGSVAVAAAARSLSIPVVLHEANAAPGLGNRIAALWAARICVGFDQAAAWFDSRKVVRTGTPCGNRVQGADRAPWQPPFRILVMGGSLGSPFLNREAPGLFGELVRRGVAVKVRHLAGCGSGPAVQMAYEAAGVHAEVREFEADMASAYAGCDFAVSSAGALTLAELAAAGVPALIVPQEEAAEGHQIANARLYAGTTGARWARPRDWDARVEAEWLADFLNDSARVETMREQAGRWSRPDAARSVIEVCLGVFKAIS